MAHPHKKGGVVFWEIFIFAFKNQIVHAILQDNILHHLLA
jgi:hypothetical protein